MKYFFIIGLFFLFSCHQANTPPVLQETKNSQNHQEIIPEENKKIVVIPHHNITNAQIEEFYKTLAQDYGDFKNIVIISPNHFFPSKEKYISSFPESGTYCFGKTQGICNSHIKKFDFYIPQENDTRIFNKQEDTYFFTEHGIGNHFSFLKTYFPKSSLYALLLNIQNFPDIETENLAEVLFEYPFSGKTLFVFSVDFSHHVPENVAVFHDLKTIEYLNSTHTGTDIEVDCPNCLYLAKNLAQKNGSPYFHFFSRTSVQDITKKTANYLNTSHIFGWFQSHPDSGNRETMNGKYQESYFENPLLQRGSGSVYGTFFGDAHFTRWFSDAHNKTPQSTYFSCFYQGKDIQKDPDFWFNRILYSFDFSGLNLETSVTNQENCEISSKSIVFRTEPEYLKRFKTIGFNLFDVANNHSYDCGKTGFLSTIEHIKEQKGFYFGDGREDISFVYKTEKNGNKIAFIGLNDVERRIDETLQVQKISKLTEQGYIVILNIHWGQEYSLHSNERQQRLAKLFVDAGAKLIVGHHPHVVQESEIYKGVPIFYSLGNFIFDQPFPETLKGYMLAYSIDGQKVRYNLLEFTRDAKNYFIDCESFE